MKKVLILVLALLVCAGAAAALISHSKHEKQETLLQQSIDAFHNGDLKTASEGFHTLAKETGDPDMGTVYQFVEILRLFQSEDPYHKQLAYERVVGVNPHYKGLLAEEIHAYAQIISEEAAKYEAEEAARQQQELLERITKGKPFVGMDSAYIDQTSLGRHNKTGHNTVKVAGDPPAKKRDCTLYYWMDGDRCIFIAQVRDDLGEVINVEENPAGSYFGN